MLKGNFFFFLKWAKNIFIYTMYNNAIYWSQPNIMNDLFIHRRRRRLKLEIRSIKTVKKKCLNYITSPFESDSCSCPCSCSCFFIHSNIHSFIHWSKVSINEFNNSQMANDFRYSVWTQYSNVHFFLSH